METRSGLHTGVDQMDESSGGAPTPDTVEDERLGPVGLLVRVANKEDKGLGAVFCPAVIENLVKEVCGVNVTRSALLDDRTIALQFGGKFALLPRQKGDEIAGQLHAVDSLVFTPCVITAALKPHAEVSGILDALLSAPRDNANNSAQTRSWGRALVNESDLGYDEDDEVALGRRRQRRRRSHPRRAHPSSESESEYETDRSRRSFSAPSRSSKTPVLKTFWGNPSKDEVDYGSWRAQVNALAPHHQVGVMKEALSRSLKGDAFGLFTNIDPESRSFVQDLLYEMDAVFGTLPDYEILFTELSTAAQGKEETVSTFARRLSAVAKRIEQTFPNNLYPERKAQNDSLAMIQADRMYKGLRKPLRDALRAQVKSGKKKDYRELVIMAREVEADDLGPQTEKKQEKKEESAPTNPKPRSVLPSPVKKFFGQKRAVFNHAQLATVQEEAVAEPEEPAGAEAAEEEALSELIQSSVAQALQRAGFADKKKSDECYNCGGLGHMARACPSPKNAKDGGAKPSAPPKENTTQGAQQNNQAANPAKKEPTKQ